MYVKQIIICSPKKKKKVDFCVQNEEQLVFLFLLVCFYPGKRMVNHTLDSASIQTVIDVLKKV